MLFWWGFFNNSPKNDNECRLPSMSFTMTLPVEKRSLTDDLLCFIMAMSIVIESNLLITKKIYQVLLHSFNFCPQSEMHRTWGKQTGLIFMKMIIRTFHWRMSHGIWQRCAVSGKAHFVTDRPKPVFVFKIKLLCATKYLRGQQGGTDAV